jgi:hypothetical protein
MVDQRQQAAGGEAARAEEIDGGSRSSDPGSTGEGAASPRALATAVRWTSLEPWRWPSPQCGSGGGLRRSSGTQGSAIRYRKERPGGLGLLCYRACQARSVFTLQTEPASGGKQTATRVRVQLGRKQDVVRDLRDSLADKGS